MEIARSDTARTMVSRAHSSSELRRALSYIMKDGETMDLPDDLEKLED